MINKWFLGSLLAVLALIGISLDQTAGPNQEIIIKFSDSNTLQENGYEAVILVRSELEKINVSNINIEEFINGTLKITYYSDLEVREVKKIFSESTVLSQSLLYASQEEDKEHPFDNKNIGDYYLDVFKIQDSNDVDGHTGAIVDYKSDYTRFSRVHGYAYLKAHDIHHQNNVDQIAYQTSETSALTIDNSSYKIPEVRAGPIS